MGAPKGNQNARKTKDWESTLRRVLTSYESPEQGIQRGQALAKIAETCVLQAIAGDKDARAEIANRLDGKAKETIEATFTHHLAEALSDDELAGIATGSSAGAAETPQSPQEPTPIH